MVRQLHSITAINIKSLHLKTIDETENQFFMSALKKYPQSSAVKKFNQYFSFKFENFKRKFISDFYWEIFVNYKIINYPDNSLSI